MRWNSEERRQDTEYNGNEERCWALRTMIEIVKIAIEAPVEIAMNRKYCLSVILKRFFLPKEYPTTTVISEI
jgi:hypothetical protein